MGIAAAMTATAKEIAPLAWVTAGLNAPESRYHRRWNRVFLLLLTTSSLLPEGVDAGVTAAACR